MITQAEHTTSAMRRGGMIDVREFDRRVGVLMVVTEVSAQVAAGKTATIPRWNCAP